ncbi:MAG: membrane protein insertase YidC [Sphingobacteriales bacterium]|nr:MAG: membrane protein insertase YidC [Sphingobacteriales bacterium]
MGMDKNTLIGFGLIGALLIAMFVINSKSRLATEGEKKRIADSIALMQAKADSNALKNNVAVDTAVQGQQPTTVFPVATIAEELVPLENELLKITFSNKGAQPVKVELKKFKKYDGTPVLVLDGAFNKFSYAVNAGNRSEQSSEMFFTASPVVKNADGSQAVSFSSKDSTGKELTHQYIIRPNDYMVDFNISVNGASQLFTQNTMNLLWQVEAEQVEKDHKYELTQTHVAYVAGGDYDFEYVNQDDDKKFSKSVDWLALKQQFFITTLVAKNKFNSANIAWTVPQDTTGNYLARSTTNATITLPAGNAANIPLQLYYGPSDYNALKKYDNQMENIVPYGSGVFAFVKYINRHFLLPVFDFLQKNVASMGIVILLLTLLIRLITSPILYKSYLSGAKMKMLKPEVDALKEKYKDDQQAFGMEQMKLWRSAGVNPLGGCLPALLQIPIFMSLYYFFQSNIDLRGKNFLWANDLAQYDSIAQLPFNIPFYGDHVSLFTLTATITSLLISIYSMSNMQDNTNPVMKYMPYIFPILLLGVFNTLPSALTWYYTVSNTITLLLQIIIQKYIINHDKIMEQINENRKKPVKKSKLQERVEAMQESQKKMQDMKNKSAKK